MLVVDVVLVTRVVVLFRISITVVEDDLGYGLYLSHKGNLMDTVFLGLVHEEKDLHRNTN